jgi:hypothetical protein
VVQTTTIFANVSKGVLAKHEDMQAVFGSTDEDAICRCILQDGDLQVTFRYNPLVVCTTISLAAGQGGSTQWSLGLSS